MIRYMALDTETTGLEPGVNGILTGYFVEVGLHNGKFTPNTKKELDISIHYEEEEMPKIDKVAMNVNKIELANFKGKYNKVQAVKAIIELKQRISPMEKVRVFGHNVAFDVGFLKQMFKDVGQKWEKHFHYRTSDSMNSASYLQDAGLLDCDLGLERLTSYFDIEIGDGKAHEARYDVLACIELYSKLLKLPMQIGADR